MITNKRRGYETPELAIAGGILQMEQVEAAGVAQSVEDAKSRHDAACNATALKEIESREMMDRLRGNLKIEPLSPKDLASRVYPGRKY